MFACRNQAYLLDPHWAVLICDSFRVLAGQEGWRGEEESPEEVR